MNEREFRAWPYLLFKRHVLEASGYSNHTLRKMVDCGVLSEIRPPGSGQRRFQKVQLARVLRISIAEDLARFNEEHLLMSQKSAFYWTGYSPVVLEHMARLGGIHQVRLAGLDNARYLKAEIAELIGFSEYFAKGSNGR